MKFFRRYTFFSLLFLSIGVLFIVIALYLNSLYQSILEKNLIYNNENVFSKYEIIESYLLNTKKDLYFISKLYEEIDDINILIKTLKVFSDKNSIYSQIRYINNLGKEILRIDHKNNKSIIIAQNELQYKKDRYYFKESLNLTKNEIYLSLFDLNVEKNKIEIPYNPTLRFSTPILTKNKKIDGYAIINYSGKKLLDIIKQDDGFYLMLLNKNSGYLVSTLMPEKEWSFMLNKDDGLKVSNPKIWKKIQLNDSKKVVFKLDNKFYSVIKINPIEIISPNRKEKSRRQWYLISYFDNQKIFNEFLMDINTLKLPLIFIIIILILASYILAYYLKKLEKANERVSIASSAFENSQEGILVLNQKGQIVNINKGFTTITGYSFDEVYLKKPKFFKDTKDEFNHNFFEKIWKKIYKKDFWSGELYHKKKNGQKFIGHLTVSTIKERNKIKYLVCVFSDITQMVKQKEKIEKTNKELLQTLEHLNVAQEQLIESEKLAALGQLIAGIAHEINSPLGAIKTSSSNVFDALNKTLLNKPQLDLILNNNEKKLLDELQVEILSNNNDYLSIKEQRYLKKEIRNKLIDLQIDEARYLSDILSSFMLTDLEKYLPLLKHEEVKFIFTTINDEFITVSNLENIQNSVKRASKTIFALKKFAHFNHDGEGTYQKLENEIENVLILLAHNLKQNIEIIKSYEELEPIFCYPDELGQVWINLITNAAHAMNNKGTITISIYEDKYYQIVSIKDTGSGIPEDLKDEIFKPFFTTKNAGIGSGLGLDIVLKVVEAHNGKIDFVSSKKGTTFYIKIPKKVKE